LPRCSGERRHHGNNKQAQQESCETVVKFSDSTPCCRCPMPRRDFVSCEDWSLMPARRRRVIRSCGISLISDPKKLIRYSFAHVCVCVRLPRARESLSHLPIRLEVSLPCNGGLYLQAREKRDLSSHRPLLIRHTKGDLSNLPSSSLFKRDRSRSLESRFLAQ